MPLFEFGFTDEELNHLQEEIPEMDDEQLHALVKRAVPALKAAREQLREQSTYKEEPSK